MVSYLIMSVYTPSQTCIQCLKSQILFCWYLLSQSLGLSLQVYSTVTYDSLTNGITQDSNLYCDLEAKMWKYTLLRG
jgi:hypothetical protein